MRVIAFAMFVIGCATPAADVSVDAGVPKDTGEPESSVDATSDASDVTQACACDAGHSCCATACVDLLSDPSNCGDCGHTCETGVCFNGLCSDGTCSIDKGGCAHSPCMTGVALNQFCDPEGVAFTVCVLDKLTYCCGLNGLQKDASADASTAAWDQACVDDAAQWESFQCTGDGC